MSVLGFVTFLRPFLVFSPTLSGPVVLWGPKPGPNTVESHFWLGLRARVRHLLVPVRARVWYALVPVIAKAKARVNISLILVLVRTRADISL